MQKLHLLITLFLISSSLPYKPIIAIYGDPDPEDDFTYNNGTYYSVNYPKWLQKFGASPLALHQWYSESEILDLLGKVNGVLFMGGGRDFKREGNWETKATLIINYAINNSLPLWGTCQGFQLIPSLISDDLGILTNDFRNDDVMSHVIFNENTTRARMFSLFTAKDFELLEKRNSTLYFHTWAFHPDKFYQDAKVMSVLKVTGLGKDLDGKEFVNVYEGVSDKIKIFGTQFHPEKNPFSRGSGYTLEHREDSLRLGDLMGLKFVEECRMNAHRMPEDEMKKWDFFDMNDKKIKSAFNYHEKTFYFSKDKH